MSARAIDRVLNYDRTELIASARRQNDTGRHARIPLNASSATIRHALLDIIETRERRQIQAKRAHEQAAFAAIERDSTGPYQPPTVTVAETPTTAPPTVDVVSAKVLKKRATRTLMPAVPADATLDSPPKYVRAVATIMVDGVPRRTYESVFTRIRAREQVRNYLNKLIDRLLPYTLVTNSKSAHIAAIEFEIHESVGKQRLLRVADYHLENCVVNLIRGASRDVEKLYARLPHLRPTDGKVYVNHDDLDRLAKYADLHITTYTKLGSVINQPWSTHGLKKRKQLHIVVNGEHATLRMQHHKIDRIVYHDTLHIPDDTNVIECDYHFTSPGLIVPKYYIVYHDDLVHMHKSFRPSTITRNPDHDSLHEYVFTAEQMMYEMFKTKYSLEASSTPAVRAVIKRAEHFIGRARVHPLMPDAVEVDHNKNYVAYESLPEYMGFPHGQLTPALQEHAITPVFYVCSIILPPQAMIDLLGYKPSTQIVITAPVYKYLSGLNIEIDVDYVLQGGLRPISITAFADACVANDDDKKRFRNQLIGRTITGGLKEAKTVQYLTSVEVERKQIIHEAQKVGYEYGTTDYGVTVRLPSTAAPMYDFHSYVLGYASIHMMRKYTELAQHHQIAAWCVDAIVVNPGPTPPSDNDTHIGGWKTSHPKPYYRQLGKPKPVVRDGPNVEPPTRPIPTKNTVFIGAAGVGKSHPWKVQPAYDQIMLAPTHELVNEHRILFENTHTAAKYYQFGLSKKEWLKYRATGRVPRAYAVVVIDELTMFTAEQWEIIIDRSRGQTIIALGDFDQIRQCIDGTPVDPGFFARNGFDVVTIPRTRHAHARHSYEYGRQLDKLRGLKPLHQYHVAKDLFTTGQVDELDSRAIVGTHQAAHDLNAMMRPLKRVFPCRRKHKKGFVLEGLPNDSPLIWWGRTKQTDTMPPECTHEPAWAVTADSYQGKTVDQVIYVHTDSLRRHGCLYTALTRTTTREQTILLA